MRAKIPTIPSNRPAPGEKNPRANRHPDTHNHPAGVSTVNLIASRHSLSLIPARPAGVERLQ